MANLIIVSPDIRKNILNTASANALGMGQQEEKIVSRSMSGACSHGGVYSVVDYRLVKMDCSSSINPLGTPRKAIAAIQKGAKSLASQYPDPECRELKKSLSRYLRVGQEWISVGNGAMEIIYWFAQAFAKKRVVVPAPTFCEYELASRKAGADIAFVPLRDFELDADAVIEKSRDADAVFLCNPNNPTGMLATKKQVRKIIESVGGSTKILLDECFVELADDPEASMVGRIGEFDNLVILRSLTKSFGLAGLRVGYSVCNPTLAEKLSASKIPWNVNGLAQAAGVAALADIRHLTKARALVKKERKFLQDRISKLKMFSPVRSDANYFMIHLQGRNSTHFRDALLKKTGVLVRDCSTFTGIDSQHIRAAVKTHKENLLLLQALEAFDNRDG